MAESRIFSDPAVGQSDHAVEPPTQPAGPIEPTGGDTAARPVRPWLIVAGVAMLLLGTAFLSGGIARLGGSPGPGRPVAGRAPGAIASTPRWGTTNPAVPAPAPSVTRAAGSPSAGSDPKASNSSTSQSAATGAGTVVGAGPAPKAAPKPKSAPKKTTKKTTKKPVPKKTTPAGPVVLADASPGSAVLRSQTTGLCLDSNEAGAIYGQPCNGGQYQRWTAIPIGGASTHVVWLQDVQTGRCLNESNTAGLLLTEPCTDSDTQQEWRWTGTNGGSTYQVLSVGLCLDGDSTGLVLSNPCGSASQNWQQS